MQSLSHNNKSHTMYTTLHHQFPNYAERLALITLQALVACRRSTLTIQG